MSHVHTQGLLDEAEDRLQLATSQVSCGGVCLLYVRCKAINHPHPHPHQINQTKQVADLEAKLQQQAEEGQAALRRVEEALKEERAARETVRGEVEARRREHEGAVQVCVRLILWCACFLVLCCRLSRHVLQPTQNLKTHQALQADLDKAQREGKAKATLARKLLEEKDREIALLRAAVEQQAQQPQLGQGQQSPHTPGAGGAAVAAGAGGDGVVGEESKVEESSSTTNNNPSSPAAAAAGSPPPPQRSPPPQPLRPMMGAGATTAADFAEQQLFQLARKQAQRDEELGRLKQQMRHIGALVVFGCVYVSMVFVVRSCNRAANRPK